MSNQDTRTRDASGGGVAHTAVVNTASLVERMDPRATKRSDAAFGQSRLVFKDLTFSILREGVEKLILSPCSGVFEPGEMCAIMGPSGCGKTTLLDMLAGKKTAQYSGEVFLNGLPRDTLFPRLTSYVPQSDTLPAYLTVGEALKFVHQLRVEGNMTEADRDAAVSDCLSLLGIDTIQNELIGDEHERGISGGQKRRLTLARGLIGGSQIVFADEPTSGLSSTDAETVVRAMCVAAKKLGVLFVTVIHQPRAEVANMFDTLLLLTSSPGRMVYNGPFDGAAKYFAKAGYPAPNTCNPADFLLDIITPGAFGEQSNYFAQRYVDVQHQDVEARVAAALSAPKKTAFEVLKNAYAIQGFATSALHESPIAATFSNQFYTLLSRELTMTKRNKSALRVRYGTAMMQGIIVGCAFYNIASREPILQLSFMFMILQMGTIANMAILPKLINSRFVYKLEISDGLFGEVACTCVNALVNNTLAISGNFLTTFILFAFSCMPWKHFGTLYLWSLLSFCVVTSYLRVIAQIARSGDTALQTAMPFLLGTILFNNFFISRASGTFLKFLIYVSPMAWAMEQIATSIYGSNEQMMSLYEYKSSDAWTTVALFVLLSESVFFQCLEFVALRRAKGAIR